MPQYRTLGLIVAGVTLCLALASILLSIQAARQLFERVKLSEQSERQFGLSVDLLLDVLDMETGVRGYVMTDDPAYLEPYEHASKRIKMHLSALIQGSEDSPLLTDLASHVAKARDFFETVLELRKSENLSAAQSMAVRRQGKLLVDNVRDDIGRFQTQEKRRYAGLIHESNQSFSNAIFTTIASGCCVIAFILFYFALSRHYNLCLLKQTNLAVSNEKNYRTLVDSAPIGIFQLALDGSITEANKLLMDLLRVHREKLMSASVFDFINDGDKEAFRAEFEEVRQGKVEHVTLHHKLVGNRQDEIWINSTLSLMRGDDGKPLSIIAAVVDESDTHAMEIVRKQMQAIVNGSNDAVISKSLEGVITSWNPAAERLFGYSQDEIVGQLVYELVPQELQESEAEMLKRCAAGEYIAPFHTTRIHRDGRRIEVLLNVMPLFDTNGAGLGICTIIRDLTAQLQAAASLQESDRRFQMLADNMSQFAWIANADGWIYWYNKRWYDYTGTTLDEMQGWGWTKVHHPDHVDRVLLHISKCWETGSPWEDTFPLRGKDGNYRWFLSRALPIHDAEGRISCWFGSNTDITELIENEESLKRARQQAEDASRARGEFLANMSHEIRTPMTAILGHADILAEHLRDPDDIQSVETIRRSSQYLLQIINDILDLSKIDSGKFRTELVEFSPSVIMHELRSLLDVRAAEKRLVFEGSIQGRIPKTIVSDPIRLRQILVNLAGNAIKFTDFGRVDVICSFNEERRRIRFAVKDTGNGIPKELLESIFQPFVQADASSTRAFEGTGLGLAISKRLAHALGGDITVQSTVGKGSTFVLEIDSGLDRVNEWIDHLEAPITQPANVLLNTIAGTILVVDDRRDIRYLVQNFLEKAGAKVITATNGQEAINLLSGLQPIGDGIAGVVMDMQMPVMDGYTAAKELRRLGYKKAIIALTANAMKEDREKCIQSGCDDYAIKPLDVTTLVHVVASNICKQR